MSATAASSSNHLCTAAYEYAARGWAVFPVVPRGKRPATSHGYKDATTDAKLIERWWPASSRCNVAIATGKISGLVVLDVDGEDGKIELRALERENGQLPRTPRARTGGGGEHIYLDARTRSLPSSAGRVGRRVDVRGEGGYAVAPPSEHESGERYAWLPGASPDDVPLAPIPDWLIRLASRKEGGGQQRLSVVLRDPKAHLAAALRSECRRVASARPGERNRTLNGAAFAIGQLLQGELGLDQQVESQLLAAARSCGLPDGEAKRTLSSALAAGRSAPRVRIHSEAEPRMERRSSSGAVHDWNPLLPLALPPLPSFPVSAFPQRLAAWVRAEAVASQTPVDLSAVVSLATVSAACGGRLVIEVRPGWVEPANIYSAVVLGPGNRKSAVFRAATQPLFDFERQVAEEMGPVLAESRAALRIAEERLKVQESKSARNKANADELREAVRAVEECRRAVPVVPKLVCADVTPEELVRQLEQQRGSIALMDAEGCGPLSIMLGRYSGDRAPQLDVFLRAHSGDSIRVNRVNREPSAVCDPALTIGITTQPAMLEQLTSLPRLRGLGLLARFLWALPDSLLGQREVRPSRVPADVQRDYDRTISTLLSWKYMKAGERIVLRFSEEADGVLAQFERELEPRLGVGCDLEPIGDWAAKLSGAIVRVAGLLHAADHLDRLEHHKISVDTLCRAIAIGEYFLPHAKAALVPRVHGSCVNRAREIVAWLRKTKALEFNKRECFIALRAEGDRVVDFDPALRLLEAQSWVAELAPVPREGAGRKPSTRYAVNPLVHDAQNTQK